MVLQRAPGIHATPGARGSVRWKELRPEHVRVSVSGSSPSVVLIRNSFDPDWSYSIDGGPSHQVLAADYFLQGVPVPAGTHTIDLTYDDPKIGEGIAISGAGWGAFALGLAAAFVGRRRLRRRRPTPALSPTCAG